MLFVFAVMTGAPLTPVVIAKNKHNGKRRSKGTSNSCHIWQWQSGFIYFLLFKGKKKTAKNSGKITEVECETCGEWKTLPPEVCPHDLPDEWHCQLRTWKKPETEEFCRAPNARLIKAWQKVLERRRADGFVTEADGGKIGTPNQFFFSSEVHNT